MTVLALQHFLGIGIKIKEIKYMNENTAFDKAIKYAPSANMLAVSQSGNNGYFIWSRLKAMRGIGKILHCFPL